MHGARALGTLLLLLLMVGCTKTPSPPPELRQEYTAEFLTVPELPTSTELKREFLHNDDDGFILQVTFDVTEYHFHDRNYRKTFGGDVWAYKGSKTEIDTHYYTKNGWRLAVKQGPRDSKVRVLISKEE